MCVFVCESFCVCLCVCVFVCEFVCLCICVFVCEGHCSVGALRKLCGAWRVEEQGRDKVAKQRNQGKEDVAPQCLLTTLPQLPWG